MATGVYCIRNLTTGSFYIGSTARSIDRRWLEHRNELDAGTHANYRLQPDWKFYGESGFKFSIIEACPPDKCLGREQWFIDIFDPVYNISRIAGAPMKGRKQSPEARAKIGAASRGNKHCLGHYPSPETRAKMGISQAGRHHTPEARAKISAAMMGNQRGLGHHPSKDARSKMSAAQKGRPRVKGLHPSPETRAKLSASMMGNHKGKRRSHQPTI